MVRGRMAYNFYTPFYPCRWKLKIHPKWCGTRPPWYCALKGPPPPALRPPYLRRTIAVPTRDIRRCMFGFRLKAKSEDIATMVRRWYDDGTAQNRRKKASRNWAASAKMARDSPPGTRTHQMQRGTGASLASVPLCTL